MIAKPMYPLDYESRFGVEIGIKPMSNDFMVYDPHPFVKEVPNYLTPDGYVNAIVWAPEETINEIGKRAIYDNTQGTHIKTNLAVIHEILAEYAKGEIQFPTLPPLESVLPPEKRVLLPTRWEKDLVDRLDKLAHDREEPRYQVVYEILSDAANALKV